MDLDRLHTEVELAVHKGPRTCSPDYVTPTVGRDRRFANGPSKALGMSSTIGEEHHLASDQVNDFGCLRLDWIQRGVPRWIVP